jgi:Putative DNA-binding domain/Putative RNA methylase family UPF0020
VAIDFSQMRERLQQFDFPRLFVEELGWSKPSIRDSVEMTVKNAKFTRRQISHLAGVAVFEVSAEDGRIPDAKTRAAIDKEVSALFHEHLLIFIDKDRTQSLWYWVKREDGKAFPRDHFYLKGQPGDLFLSKLGGIVFEITDFDRSGNVPVFEVAQKLRGALDVERVTKKFYGEFYEEHVAFIDYIHGIPDEKDRRWYASVLLNRLMFVYFLQRKRFIDNGNLDYLQNKLTQSREKGRDLYYSGFLKLLFFEGFAKPEEERSPKARQMLGSIKYLNGGLFLPHRVEQEYPDIRVPDKAFENILALFQRYSWNLNDTPGGQDNEISPDVLGYIFEKYINQKAFGAYYTRQEITEYLCGQTIHKLILNAVNTPEAAKSNPINGLQIREYHTIAEVLMDLDGTLCRELLFNVLPNLTLLDPACGSGAFLVAAMKVLINIYAAVVGKIKFLNQKDLTSWLDKTEREHKSLSYFIKKRIITDNLYGVDIMEEATEIAKLRLFLALVAAAESVDQLEPLPNIDFNILPGNSLVGLIRVNDKEFEERSRQGNLFRKTYRQVLDEKNRLIDTYRHAVTYAQDLSALRNNIQEKKEVALATLNDILREEFKQLNIKFEQSTWDEKGGEEGRSIKRSVTIRDVETLQPFHWGFEFDKVLNERGGFDAIITNPPWEIFKPNSKEFFEEYSDLVTKKKMTIHEFEKEKAKLLKDKDIRAAWLEYLSDYPHVSAYYRSATQYRNQVSVVNGKKAGADINLYKLFTELCFNLLRDGGQCGVVIPSGIYTDLGTKQLREMLFDQTKITGLFGFENRKEVFENVHRSYKFVILTLEKGGQTRSFPAAFMRLDPEELERFPQQGAIEVSTDLIRRLAPDSLSLMEFKNEVDVRIAEKLLRFPALNEHVEDKWNIKLTNEFHMTGNRSLFKTQPGTNRLTLYEGKMIHQFSHEFSSPRYWIDENAGRRELLGSEKDHGQIVDYQRYRLVHRSIGRNTDQRTMIATIIPPGCFYGHSLNGSRDELYGQQMVFATALFNSFTLDYQLRQSVSANLTMFFIYQLRVPRIGPEDPRFTPIAERAGRLLCTTSEFDQLAKELGLEDHTRAATDPVERARVRAELDGLIAHLYGLTEEEFSYVLSTFSSVEDSTKEAALTAYRAYAPRSVDEEVKALILAGENSTVEFKSSARWDIRQNILSKTLEQVIVKTVAGFLNSETGGTLIIGVDDAGQAVGLDHDYKTLGKKQDRDGYENWLTTLLLDQFGKESSPFLRISFHNIGGVEVCQISIKPSPKPAFVKDGIAENLFVRTGNSTRQLTTREGIEYCKHRWKL